MKNFGGVWLPDGEQHLVEWMRRVNRVIEGRLTYQFHKLEAALEYVERWGVAVDVGAHCGLWAMHLARRFARVEAFEPVPEHRECFVANVRSPHVRLHACALGAAAGSVRLRQNGESTGDTCVIADGEGIEAECRRLDDCALDALDFLKIDCEGYELEVIQGGIGTLRRCRPVVVVEQKPARLERNFGRGGTPAVDLLRELGAQVMREISGDYIMRWPG